MNEVGGATRRRLKVGFERGLNLLTLTVAILAAYLLATERLIPALRGAPTRTLEGEQLSERLQFRVLSGERNDGPAQTVPDTGRTLLLVFSSTCPACFENLPAWEQVAGSGRGSVRVLAVALERDRRAASLYVRRHLPTATPVVARDAARFAAALGIEVVPFTALVAADGTVEFARPGRLDPASVRVLIDLLKRRRDAAAGMGRDEGR